MLSDLCPCQLANQCRIFMVEIISVHCLDMRTAMHGVGGTNNGDT
jgi:hypothetical protein